MRLLDKVAVITGAASGIGRATAIMFAGEGAKVVAADINDPAGMDTVAGIKSSGGEAIYVHTDVSKTADAENLIKAAIDKFGRIDILLNVVGILPKHIPLEEVDDEFWDRVYAVNVKGIVHTMKYAIPYMKKARSGSIINVAAMAGVTPPVPNSCAYSSSKGAVIALTKAVSLELAPYRVRANCLNPAGTDTPMMKNALGESGPTESKNDMLTQIPLGRFIKPEEIAYAAVFLASDESLMMTGTMININSGAI
jgi:3-oxoacyl-[acyl-carrier protein] reductase